LRLLEGLADVVDAPAGDPGRIRNLAVEIVATGPDVIFTSGFSTIRPLLDATSTLPIVFANVVDPVGAGFVASLARPGGNVTGFASYEFGFPIKWLELLKQIAPGVTRAAVLRDPTISALIGQFAAIQGAAPSRVPTPPGRLRCTCSIRHTIHR